MFTGAFWKATAERVISTAAQSALLAIGADQFNVLNADFGVVLGFAGGGAVLSLLKALVAGAANPATGPSFGAETPVKPNAPYTGGH